MSTDDIASRIMRQRMAETERHLITAVEQIEGRVPSNDEIRRHGHCAHHLDGRAEWKWRGQTILIVHPPRWADNGALLVDFETFGPR